MKNRNLPINETPASEIVVSFGAADLIKVAEANYQLQGASADDRTSAKEWISLFMHEAVMGESHAAPANFRLTRIKGGRPAALVGR